MRVDIGRGQPNAEIGGQRSVRVAVAEDAVEDEIAGRLAIMRVLPIPAHGCGIGERGNRFARDRVGVAEIPQRQRLLAGACGFVLIDADEFLQPELVPLSDSERPQQSPVHGMQRCYEQPQIGAFGVGSPEHEPKRIEHRHAGVGVGEAVHELRHRQPRAPSSASQSGADHMSDSAELSQCFVLAAEQAHTRFAERRRLGLPLQGGDESFSTDLEKTMPEHVIELG